MMMTKPSKSEFVELRSVRAVNLVNLEEMQNHLYKNYVVEMAQNPVIVAVP